MPGGAGFLPSTVSRLEAENGKLQGLFKRGDSEVLTAENRYFFPHLKMLGV